MSPVGGSFVAVVPDAILVAIAALRTPVIVAMSPIGHAVIASAVAMMSVMAVVVVSAAAVVLVRPRVGMLSVVAVVRVPV